MSSHDRNPSDSDPATVAITPQRERELVLNALRDFGRTAYDDGFMLPHAIAAARLAFGDLTEDERAEVQAGWALARHEQLEADAAAARDLSQYVKKYRR